jgi:branched-chain amino acid transport system substrate-binding protein
MSSPNSPASTSTEAVVLRVVGSLTGPHAEADATYLDGIRLGETVVNRRGGIDGAPLDIVLADDRGDPEAEARLVQGAVLAPDVAATLVVGDGRSVTAARLDIEWSRTPVLLLRGDLYSSRELFRQVFQTSIPLRWQAAVLARYLVVDRRYENVALVFELPPRAVGARGERERAVFRAAMAEEGAGLWKELGLSPSFSADVALRSLGGADAVAYVGGPTVGTRLARMLSGLEDRPQLATSTDGLQETFAGSGPPVPGTVAPYAYTWAGWAEPIRRVAAFRELCRRELGHPPRGFEQEGYDAVRVLAEALERTGGEGGDRLVRALESVEDVTYSSLPIGLGPDDHLFLSDRQLGLFAVAGPDEESEAWAPEWAPWRPVMRTFTTNGERTTVIDRDKDVFFPGWHAREPAPDFWTARYGIVTRRRDPLH